MRTEPEGEGTADLKDALDEGRDQGRITLRRLQWQQAQNGNVIPADSKIDPCPCPMRD
jgi:hypothetical protein